MRETQMQFAFGPELIVDLFAGGGGASLGIEQAFGRHVDIAVNHDADAIAMHAANHPQTEHMRCDVFEVNPLQATRGRQVGLLWASPDCKHFSKAKGGKPRSKKIRSLAWVVVRWASLVRPRVIMLENVEEFVTWGPLGKDGMPCPQRKGRTFNRWVGELRRLGYKVEWRELRACDYGAPTIRKRFFLIARCDGLPIRWPKPTHGKPDSPDVRRGRLLPWRSAADCIDFSLPCPSIFLSKEEARALGVKRPLAEATMRRIAKGVDRFVLNSHPRPFIVRNIHGNTPADVAAPMPTLLTGNHTYLAAPTLVDVAHGEVGQNGSRRWSDGAHSAEQPCKTVTASGNQALVSAFLTKYRGENAGTAGDAPFPTLTANGESERPGGNPPVALVSVHMEQANAGNYDGGGRAVDAPVSTITAKGCQQQVVATTLHRFPGVDEYFHDGFDPEHAPQVKVLEAIEARREQVRTFLVKFYSEGGQHAVVTHNHRERITVDGADYAIADIGLRMLTPRELFRAQGFPEDYVIDRGADGRKLPKDAQVRMCGNSVCPPIARALVEANVGELRLVEEVAYA